MRIFVDTANIEEIKTAYSLGIVSGVTTNPALVKREGTKDIEGRLKEICSVAQGDVLTQVVGSTAEEMIRQAQTIASWDEKMVVKIPLVAEGVTAVSRLSQLGIRTCMTTLFTPGQALAAALAGATYISPFVERSNAIGRDGIQLVRDIAKIYQAHKVQTKILAASIVSPQNIVDVALAGADAVTAPGEVIFDLIRNATSESTVTEFLDGWSGDEVESY